MRFYLLLTAASALAMGIVVGAAEAGPRKPPTLHDLTPHYSPKPPAPNVVQFPSVPAVKPAPRTNPRFERNSVVIDIPASKPRTVKPAPKDDVETFDSIPGNWGPISRALSCWNEGGPC